MSQKYRLGGRIGGGGMAEVLHATAVGVEGFARPVAVKRIQPQLSADSRFGEMFINEARIASLLHHPNIAAVIDFDRDDDGTYYLVMELIHGIDLRTLRGSGPLPFDVVTYIIAEVLKGLAYAHELVHDGKHLGIVHRDVSPHNVMIGWDGSVKLVDFGIAKAVAATSTSQVGGLKGKVAYMSPEQAHGASLDGRSDVFAVGVMLHELLTGARLFTGATEPEVLARLLNQPISPPMLVRPEVPKDLSAVTLRMLERDKRRRYRHARAALEALLACSTASARGALALQDVLRQRFPDQAPRIPTAVSTPRSFVETAPPGQVAAAMPTPARPVPVRTLTSPGSNTPSTVSGHRGSVRRRGRSHAISWIAGGLGFMVAAGVILFATLSGGSHSTAHPPVAAAGVGAPADAAPAIVPTATVPPDAAPLPPPDAAPPPPDAAPPRRRSASRHHARSTSHHHEAAADAAPGTLTIAVDTWANVTVDGTPRGSTPFKGKLAPGTHKVELTNDALGKHEVLRPVVRSGLPTRITRHW